MRRQAAAWLYRDTPSARLAREVRERWRASRVPPPVPAAPRNLARRTFDEARRTFDEARPPGANVCGYLTGCFGLAEAARAVVGALRAVDVPLALNNITAPGHRSDDDELAGFSETNPYAVNVVAVNVDMIGWLLDQLGLGYFDGHRNIAVWYWELPDFPERWRWTFGLFDEIWVMSSYCQETLGRASPVPVRRVPYPLRLPDAPLPGRPELGVPGDAFVFLTSFDYASAVERKNPLGAIRAFRRAFPGGRGDAVLVVKTINEHVDPASARLLRSAARDAKVVFLDRHMTRVEMAGLVASCDVYVSLHRSEGLGLVMAEAMAYGKPVVATGYSGNLDFMSAADSVLIGHRPVRLRRDHGPYHKGSWWAEPDVAEASAAMRWLREDPSAAARLGAQAAQAVRKRLDPLRAGQEMGGLIQALCNPCAHRGNPRAHRRHDGSSSSPAPPEA